jgi:hypothetical protein
MLRPLSIGMILSLLLLLAATSATPGASTPLDAETMKAGLHTAAPEEDGFIDRAVEMVDEGRLSAGLVHGTFVWARAQPRRKFQHFRYGLVERAPSEETRTELATGQRATPNRAPTLRERVADRLRQFFGILPSVHFWLMK